MTTAPGTVRTVPALAVGLLAAASFALPATGTPPVTCGGLPATIIDSNASHTVLGTPGDDIIAARGGDDLVLGKGGRDRICLGTGRDIGTGGAGNDEFHAEQNANGQDGRDDFYGGTGQDSVRYIGRSVGVTVSLDGVANDGQAGEQDNVRGSTENVQGTSAGDQILGNDLDNVFIGSSGDDDLRGGAGDDDLYGLAGDDLLIGNAGRDHLSGYDGSDRFLAAGSPDGDDQMFGGRGFDTMDYSGRNAGDGVTVVLDNEFNDGSVGEFDLVRTDVEHVIGGAGNDNLTAGAHTEDITNRLDGGLGNDTLNTIDGSWDVAEGGSGLDLCFTDHGDERFNCELP